ncbi:MAG: arsenate reductase family protein [Anaerovoracaceae bacterium]
MVIYCYPKCSTCKKAIKWLDDRGIEYEYKDISLENPNAEELGEFYKKSGLEIKRFFNTSGLKYRELNLKDRLIDMDEKEKLELLGTDGMLVKRPLVIGENFVLTGFKEVEWTEYII